MATRFKQPCIFPDLTAAPVPCVPDKTKSTCCGCEESCLYCADIGIEYKFIGEDICLPCQAAHIEFKWDAPPASLTGQLLGGETLRYQIWRTRLLTGNEEFLDGACNPACPSNPSGFTSRPALLGECTPDAKLYDEVAIGTIYPTPPLIPPVGFGIGLHVHADTYKPDPNICLGIMPNFVFIAIAKAAVGIGFRELARCHICPLTPTITNAWRKPQHCPGKACCPTVGIPECVTSSISGEGAICRNLDESLYTYNGPVDFPDGNANGRIEIGCSDAGGIVTWTFTVYKIIDDEQVCFQTASGGGPTGVYEWGGGDCGFGGEGFETVEVE